MIYTNQKRILIITKVRTFNALLLINSDFRHCYKATYHDDKKGIELPIYPPFREFDNFYFFIHHGHKGNCAPFQSNSHPNTLAISSFYVSSEPVHNFLAREKYKYEDFLYLIEDHITYMYENLRFMQNPYNALYNSLLEEEDDILQNTPLNNLTLTEKQPSLSLNIFEIMDKGSGDFKYPQLFEDHFFFNNLSLFSNIFLYDIEKADFKNLIINKSKNKKSKKKGLMI